MSVPNLMVNHLIFIDIIERNKKVNPMVVLEERWITKVRRIHSQMSIHFQGNPSDGQYTFLPDNRHCHTRKVKE